MIQNTQSAVFQDIMERVKMTLFIIIALYVVGGLFYLSVVLPAKAIAWFRLPEGQRRHPLYLFFPTTPYFAFLFFNYGITTVGIIFFLYCNDDPAPLKEYTAAHIIFFLWIVMGPIVSLIGIVAECMLMRDQNGYEGVEKIDEPVQAPEPEVFTPRAPAITRFDLTPPRRTFSDDSLN